ncbi:MAG: VWA domain-containing protein, partial [Eubacteriaceae bacterium]|nr:VWA domain-containing protein [Eubacteriaceae bacterium]
MKKTSKTLSLLLAVFMLVNLMLPNVFAETEGKDEPIITAAEQTDEYYTEQEDNVPSAGSAPVTNREVETPQITVTVNWAGDLPEDFTYPEAVYVTMERSVDGENWEPYEEGGPFEVTPDASNNWNATFAVPAATEPEGEEEAHLYYYRVTEDATGLSRFLRSRPVTVAPADSGVVSFTNTYGGNSGYAFDGNYYKWRIHYGVMDDEGIFHEFGGPEDDFASIVSSNTPGPEQLTDSTELSATDTKEGIGLIYDFPGYMYSEAFFKQDDITGGELQACAPMLYRTFNYGNAPHGFRLVKPVADGEKPDKDNFFKGGTYHTIWSGCQNGDIYICYQPRTTPVKAGEPEEILDIPNLAQPEVVKTVTYNDDGTGTLSLSITGHEADAQQHGKADVIIVQDLSNSMNRNNRLSTAKTALKRLTATLLSQNPETTDSDEEPWVQIGMITFASHVQSQSIDGEFFTSDESKFDALVDSLIANNEQRRYYFPGYATNWEAALMEANAISVRDDAETFIIFVTDGNPTTRLSHLNYNIRNSSSQMSDGEYLSMDVYGTCEEKEANINSCYDAAVPYAEAIAAIGGKHFYSVNCLGDATRMVDITIVACGDNTALGESHSFNAKTPAALNAAFDEIVRSLAGYIVYNNVVIHDDITEFTQLDGKAEGTVSDFTYTRTENGTSQTFDPSDLGISPARYENGSIIWEMGEQFGLEDGVTYTVSCTVWPSQEAYDAVAAYENDPENNPLPSGIDPDDYTVPTNGDDVSVAYTRSSVRGNVITPKVVFRPEDSESALADYGSEYEETEGVHFSGDSYLDEAGETITAPYTTVVRQEEPLVVLPMSMKVKKTWKNSLDTDDHTFTIVLLEDEEEYKTFTIHTSDINAGGTYEGSAAEGSWMSDEESLACGLIHIEKNGTVRVYDSGHLYTLSENDYHWAFEPGSYRMMAIGKEGTGGTAATYVPTILRLVEGEDVPAGMADDDVYYKNGNNEYYRVEGQVFIVEESGATTLILTANNVRRSNLNLIKAVVDVNGTPLDDGYFADMAFTFTINMTDATGEDIWFSVFEDPNDEESIVTEPTVTGATAEIKDNEPTGFFSAESGSTITVVLKAGWNLRFINLQTGSTYTISESIEDPFSFYTASCEEASDGGFSVDEETHEINGTITEDDTSYTVKVENTYDATGDATLTANKALAEGAEWPEGKTLTLTLSAEEGTPMPETVTATLTEPGEASFGPIEYVLSDAGNTYTYTISEDGFGDGWTGSGDITVTVKVTDNKNGTLAIEVRYSPEDATIINTYSASGSFVPKATKVLKGRDLKEGEFTFTLTDSEGNVLKTVTNDAAGKVVFSALDYTEA